jgi:hypothetical protein
MNSLTITEFLVPALVPITLATLSSLSEIRPFVAVWTIPSVVGSRVASTGLVGARISHREMYSSAYPVEENSTRCRST